MVMLWTQPHAARGRVAALEHLRLAMGSPVLGGACCRRWPPPALLVLVAGARRGAGARGATFGPYAVFHLLFQETLTIRYALPLVLPVAPTWRPSR